MQLYHVGHVTHTDHHNNDYITAFHLASRPSVEDLQPCPTDMDSGLCGSLNACHQVTITHRHTDAADSPMFSLAPMLLIGDVRCANRPNSSAYDCASLQYTVQYRTVLIISPCTLQTITTARMLNVEGEREAFVHSALTNLFICTMWGKKTAPNYFSNNFVKPRSISKIFGTRVL